MYVYIYDSLLKLYIYTLSQSLVSAKNIDIFDKWLEFYFHINLFELYFLT